MKKQTLRTTFFLLLLLISLFSIQSFSQSMDWNVGTGGNIGRNGLSEALGPLIEQGGEPELYWSGGESAPFASYPVIESDNLIVSRRWPSNNQEEAWIINYNVYTGEEKWKINLPVNTYTNYSKVSAVKDNVVYAMRAGGQAEPEYLYALDIETGEIIWMSEDTHGEDASETITFKANGDIVAGDLYKLLCIDHDDGTTIWELERNGGSSDGSSISVFDNKGYYWEQSSMGMYVSACNLETGEYLYSSELIGSPGFQQGCLMVSPEGTVYAPLIRGNPEMDSLHAFTDDGIAFKHKWSYPIAHMTFGNHGVGPDGTVYTYSRNEEIVRLDPETGDVLNTSIVVSGDNGFLSATMAIGDDGMVYLSVEDWPFYKLYIFTPELDLLYSEEINGLRGVALGDSVMAINGKNNIIRAYKGRANSSVGMPESIIDKNILVYPNPSNGIFQVNTKLFGESQSVLYEVINISGQIVYSIQIPENVENDFRIDLSDKKDGFYVLKYFADNKYHFHKMIKQ